MWVSSAVLHPSLEKKMDIRIYHKKVCSFAISELGSTRDLTGKDLIKSF